MWRIREVGHRRCQRRSRISRSLPLDVPLYLVEVIHELANTGSQLGADFLLFGNVSSSPLQVQLVEILQLAADDPVVLLPPCCWSYGVLLIHTVLQALDLPDDHDLRILDSQLTVGRSSGSVISCLAGG